MGYSILAKELPKYLVLKTLIWEVLRPDQGQVCLESALRTIKQIPSPLKSLGGPLKTQAHDDI